jgi:hypothetical protein
MPVIRVIISNGEIYDLAVPSIPYDYRVPVFKAPDWKQIFSGETPDKPTVETEILKYDCELSLSAGIPTYL